MIFNKKLFLPLFTTRNIRCGFLLESPQRGDSNKYPEHMFLEVLNTILFNFSNNPFLLQLRIRSIQIVVITSFVVISNVVLKAVDCICVQNIFLVLLAFIIYPLNQIDTDRVEQTQSQQTCQLFPPLFDHIGFNTFKTTPCDGHLTSLYTLLVVRKVGFAGASIIFFIYSLLFFFYFFFFFSKTWDVFTRQDCRIEVVVMSTQNPYLKYK